MDVAKIEKLMMLMKEYGMDVVRWDGQGESISLARHTHQAGLFAPGDCGGTVSGGGGLSRSSEKVSVASEVPSARGQTSARLPEGTVITSPVVGTFYRSSSPQSAPFVELGTRVKKGQTLCIVEAMKLMNEIESEVDGEVVAILMENGKSVDFGKPLFVIAD